MLESHLLTKADFGILLSTCLAYSQVKRNELKIKQLKSDTYITKDLQGNRIPHPRPEILRGEVARRQYVSFSGGDGADHSELEQSQEDCAESSRWPQAAVVVVDDRGD